MDQCRLRDSIKKKCWRIITELMVCVYRLRNPPLAEYSSPSPSLSCFSTSPPLCAAEFFLFTCLLEVPRGLCMGTKRRKPGWALAEAAPREVVKVLNAQGMREEDEHVDEGLTLWMEEYPELWRSVEIERGSWPWQSLLTSLSSSQKLSSSLDRALQWSSLLSASANGCSLMDIIDAIGRKKCHWIILGKVHTNCRPQHTLYSYCYPSTFVHDSLHNMKG